MVIFYIFIFLFGLIIGSFLNCVIYRLEKGEQLTGRSYCPHCKHTLTWIDLIPVYSFLFLRGKCRYCHKKISMQYPIIESLTALIFFLIFIFPPFAKASDGQAILNFINLCFLLYITSSLIVIFVYDLKHYMIPDKVLFPAIAIAFLYHLIFSPQLLFINYALAGLGVAAFFCIIFIISKGTWIGFGDCKLAVLLGLLLGFPYIVLGLFLAFLFGAIIGLILMYYKKKGLKSEIPFAPFLITGTFVAMFWGPQMISWYTSLFIF